MDKIAEEYSPKQMLISFITSLPEDTPIRIANMHGTYKPTVAIFIENYNVVALEDAQHATSIVAVTH